MSSTLESPRRDGCHQVIDGVVAGCGHAGAVEFQEHSRGEPAEPLVAVDERMVVDNRVQQRGGLGPDVRIRVLAEGRRLRPCRSRTEQAQIANRQRLAEQPASELQEILCVEVLDAVDHSPSR